MYADIFKALCESDRKAAKVLAGEGLARELGVKEFPCNDPDDVYVDNVSISGYVVRGTAWCHGESAEVVWDAREPSPPHGRYAEFKEARNTFARDWARARRWYGDRFDPDKFFFAVLCAGGAMGTLVSWFLWGFGSSACTFLVVLLVGLQAFSEPD